MGEDKMPVLTNEHETTSLETEYIDEPLLSPSVHPHRSVQVVVHNRVSLVKRPASPFDDEAPARGSKRRRAPGTQTRFSVHEDGFE